MTAWSRQPLRRRLAVLSVVAVAFALLVSGAIATTSLRSYLVDQIDRQLADFLASPDLPNDRQGPGPQPRLPSELVVQYFDDEGTPTKALSAPYDDDDDDDGAAIPPMTREEVKEQARMPFTVPGVEGEGDWRVIMRTDRDGSVAVARPLDNVNEIVQRLALLLAIVGVVVVLVVGGLSLWLVRRSLRPLRDVEDTAAAIASGDMSHRVAAYPKSTEVGQVSAAMNAMLERMEGAFGERERALAEAQDSEERMRQFVADASHELRTPLTSIRGFAELYRQGAIPDSDVPGAFSRIEGESERMGGLVEDLLVLARLDQNRPLERRPVDVLAVCLEVVANARAAHQGREVLVESRLGGEGSSAPIVSGDGPRIGQIVRNLVENALQYSTGAVILSIGVELGDVVVQVVDSGPGISEADKALIFERFFRADSSRTRHSGGSGLGLSIAQALARAHLGQLSVADNPSGGSIFTLTLPLERLESKLTNSELPPKSEQDDEDGPTQ
jgi:two-component system OmpR family sensor kinase